MMKMIATVIETERTALIRPHQLGPQKPFEPEIVATKLDRKATFMNVIYVTDAGQTKEAPEVTRVKGGFVEGGTFGDVAAIFVTSRDRRSAGFSAEIQGSGMMNYYVSGVASGEWQITVDGVSYGTATATEEGGLLTFKAPAGKLVLLSE